MSVRPVGKERREASAGFPGGIGAGTDAGTADGWRIDLATGRAGAPDATSVSGGAIRAFERHPAQRRLAIDSLVELLASRRLREWAEFRAVETRYLVSVVDGLDGDLADVEAGLPGSARLMSGTELRGDGWAGLPDTAVAVAERDAGYLSPAALRRSVLDALAGHDGIRLVPGDIDELRPADDGTVRRGADAYDVVVFATGPWTGELLGRLGLDATGYRTKSIQFGLYPLEGWRPPVFIEEDSGLYGRPTADGGLLVGLPTDQWAVHPARPCVTPELHAEAVARARERFPRLRVGPPRRLAWAADCYADDPVLRLRRVGGDGHRMYTFTGGSGAAAKTALAASRAAAYDLAQG